MGFDLPTEAQWEYACRAGTETQFEYGDEADGDSMWYGAWDHVGNSDGRTHEVGGRKANRWGLHDMHGNVEEWCLDRYGAPVYGVNPRGAPDGEFRTLRGGNWHNTADLCTSAFRVGRTPRRDHESCFRGFRLSLCVP